MTDNVPVEDIAKAPKEPQRPTSGPPDRNENPFTGKDDRLAQHLGKVGNFIGGGPEKAGNIAYIVVIFSLVLLVIASGCAAYIQSEKLVAVFDRIVTGSFGLVTGALGYLFGSSDKSK